MDPVDPPQELIALVGAADTWLGAAERRGDRWWRTPEHRIVAFGHRTRLGVGAVSTVVDITVDGIRWIATEVPAGASAATPEQHYRPDALPEQLGTALRAVHDRSIADAAADALGEVRTDLDRRLADGSIDPAALPEPYRRHPADRLCSLVFDGLEDRIGDAAPVRLHGDPVVDRFWAAPDGAVTVVDGRDDLVGDRHLDLAVAHRSIHDVYGPAAVFQFYEAYGLDPDLVILDRATLAALLR